MKLKALAHLSFLSLSAALLALPLMGCKPEYPQCKKDKHCNQDLGEKCVEEMCTNCQTDADCVAKGPNGENWVCHEFRCADPATVPAGGGGGIGAPCTSLIECSDNLACVNGSCDVCTQDMDCGGGTCNLDTGRCDLGLGGGGGVCQTDDECGMDEICDGGMCVFSGLPEGGEVLCDLAAVYFGFDSPKLLPDAQTALQNAADCISQQGRQVYLEAHADPRGTEEYNILLTDKRGQAVKQYLEQLGVPGDTMQVISKGSLEATGTDDSGWSKDRRVEFIWQ